MERAEDLRPSLVDIRRAVHRDPEVAFQERGTAALVRQALERLAPQCSCRTVAETGVLASLPGEGPVVVLRACLDALPIQDATGAEYRSRRDGVSHACGHDGQVAILVGALALVAAEAPSVQVHGLFQPAEETDAGARAVLDEGLLDRLAPDVILGYHGHPGLDAGTVGVRAGPVMASITTVRCEVVGREGHGAEPHLAADAATAAASLVIDGQVALSRRIDPRQPAVFSVGRLSAGVTPNVVPGRAEVEGTLRSLGPDLEAELRSVLADVARGVEARTGTSVHLAAELVVPAVVNDRRVAGLVSRAVVETLGPGALVDPAPTLGGDDFAWYLRRVPGCYFFVGERQRGRPPYGWHDPAYELDEDALAVGSAVLAAAAILCGDAVEHLDGGTVDGARLGGREG